jgi:import receptor subunit TOM22
MMMITPTLVSLDLVIVAFSPTSFWPLSCLFQTTDLFSFFLVDSEISDDDAASDAPVDESLLDRVLALRDMVPPKARARISAATSSLVSATSTTVNYSGKGLWVLATSILLLGIPYALALGDEQQFMEEERQRGMMAEAAQGITQAGGEAKPAL